MKRLSFTFAIAIGLSMLSAVPAFSASFTVSGNIATGAQYDTYPFYLTRGDLVTATLVCDQVTPGNNGTRTLDPVLSVFVPFSASTDTALAAFYDDDGFGTAVGGFDCNAFKSSRLIFRAPQSGTFTFRADGFGSATGPYTLSINSVPGYDGIPTLGEFGLVILGLLLAGAASMTLRRRR